MGAWCGYPFKRGWFVSAKKKKKVSHHAKPIGTIDAETEPFRHQNQDVGPFIWGYYDKREYREFSDTQELVDFLSTRRMIIFAHNGGKFDFNFFLRFIKESKVKIIKERIVSMMIGECELRDSFAILPLPLKDFGGKKEIAMWKLKKKNRAKHMDEIREYLYHDCKSLYDVVKRYREIAGKKKTLASNALAMSQKIGIDPGKTNYRFDEKFRPFYHGGRTVCPLPGTYDYQSVRVIEPSPRIFNIGTILDIRSAYGYSMCHYHATGHNFVFADTLDGLAPEQIDRSFITLECYSAGAFPLRIDEPMPSLDFPHQYAKFSVTGWEYRAAKELGLIGDEKIEYVRYSNEPPITFRPYVEHWYDMKRGSEKGTADYIISKTLMLSLYGKLAENPTRYKDYVIHPRGTRVDREHGWRLGPESFDHEVHIRDALWKYQDDDGELDEEWKLKPIFRNVATGASITGFTRAHWLRAAHAIGIDKVAYGDTDSMHVLAGADLSKVSIGEELGQWEIEGKFLLGHYAGKKQYAVRLEAKDPKTGKHIEKVRCKGGKLSFVQFEKQIMTGNVVRWRNKAPTFKWIDGTFYYIVRNIRGTAISAAIAAE